MRACVRVPLALVCLCVCSRVCASFFSPHISLVLLLPPSPTSPFCFLSLSCPSSLCPNTRPPPPPWERCREGGRGKTHRVDESGGAEVKLGRGRWKGREREERERKRERR
eukprot:401854-Pleurochrysis_carterae.AAC.2